MGSAARLGPQTLVGVPATPVVGLSPAALVVGLPSTPVVGLAAALVVAAALGVGLVGQHTLVELDLVNRARAQPARFWTALGG
jgi:hypothetical protein